MNRIPKNNKVIGRKGIAKLFPKSAEKIRPHYETYQSQLSNFKNNEIERRAKFIAERKAARESNLNHKFLRKKTVKFLPPRKYTSYANYLFASFDEKWGKSKE